jgi:VanZ family protein
VIRPDYGRPNAGWEFVRRWGILCLWLTTVSILSTSAFSSAQTGKFVVPFLRWMLPGASKATIRALHAVARKGAHVAEFAMLALLWYRGLKWGKRGWQTWAALTAFGLTVLSGVAEELHQAFEPLRTASALDVAWDSLGALIGLAGCGVLTGALQVWKKADAPEDIPSGGLEVPAGD